MSFPPPIKRHWRQYGDLERAYRQNGGTDSEMLFRAIAVTAALLLAGALLLCCSDPVHAYEGQDVVAKVIAAEACGEGLEGMKAVANVIANRSRLWKRTLLNIVTARNQFYGYTAKHRDRLYHQCKAQADYLAEHIMELEDITDGAVYFLLPSEGKRRWHGRRTVTVKRHTFYREASL